MNCETVRSLFDEAYYGELDPERRQNFEQHLQTCKACTEEFRSFTSLLDLLKERKQEDPGANFWDGYYSRLQSRRGQRQIQTSIQKPRSLSWITQIAAALILVGSGIIIGKYYLNRNVPYVLTAKGPLAAPATTDLHVQKAQLFLQRSQVLLLGVVNADLDDLSRQKQVSRDLITQASTLKNDLKDPRYRQLRALISELEVVLLEIANLQQQGDLHGVELVKSGVDRKGVLLKINLEQMRLSDQAVKSEPNSGSKL